MTILSPVRFLSMGGETWGRHANVTTAPRPFGRAEGATGALRRIHIIVTFYQAGMSLAPDTRSNRGCLDLLKGYEKTEYDPGIYLGFLDATSCAGPRCNAGRSISTLLLRTFTLGLFFRCRLFGFETLPPLDLCRAACPVHSVIARRQLAAARITPTSSGPWGVVDNQG